MEWTKETSGFCKDLKIDEWQEARKIYFTNKEIQSGRLYFLNRPRKYLNLF